MNRCCGMDVQPETKTNLIGYKLVKSKCPNCLGENFEVYDPKGAHFRSDYFGREDVISGTEERKQILDLWHGRGY